MMQDDLNKQFISEQEESATGCCSAVIPRMPKKLLHERVLDRIYSQSMWPVRYQCEFEGEGSTLRRLHSFTVRYDGPDVTEFKKGDQLYSVDSTECDIKTFGPYGRELGLNYLFTTLPMLAILVLPGILGMKLLNKSDEAGHSNQMLATASFSGFLVTVPLFLLYVRYMSVLLAKCDAYAKIDAVRLFAEKSLVEINKGFSDMGMTVTEHRIRLYLKSKDISVGVDLGKYSQELLDLIDQYHSMSHFIPEDRDFLRLLGDPKVKTRRDLAALIKEKNRLKLLIDASGVPVFTKDEVTGIYHPSYEVMGDAIIGEQMEQGGITSTSQSAIDDLEVLVKGCQSAHVKTKYDKLFFENMRSYVDARNKPDADVKKYLKHLFLKGVKVKNGNIAFDDLRAEVCQLISAAQLSQSSSTFFQPTSVVNPVHGDVEMSVKSPGPA